MQPQRMMRGGGGGGHPGPALMNPAQFIVRPPLNTLVNIVPQGSLMVVERLGRYHRTMEPGLHVLLPVLDRIRYAYSSKEQGIAIPQQSAVTKDNVMVDIDGVLFLRVLDAEKASYNIENPLFNLISLAQTTMRSAIGKMTLDTLFEERATLNKNIVAVLAAEAAEWGVECKRYEIRDISVSELVRQSMDLQAEAERRKRKQVLESEGEAMAEANVADGKRRAQELMADAEAYTIAKLAAAQAEAVAVQAGASAQSIEKIAAAMAASPRSSDAVAVRVAEQYVESFGRIAKESTTVVLPANVGDGAAFSTQALSMFRAMKGDAAAMGGVPALPKQ
jgi:regulator of protease activity HflC (stomatin/prohibitin superfamily)